MKVETVLLENKEYLILDQVKLGDFKYYILVNSKKWKRILYKKKTIENLNEPLKMVYRWIYSNN